MGALLGRQSVRASLSSFASDLCCIMVNTTEDAPFGILTTLKDICTYRTIGISSMSSRSLSLKLVRLNYPPEKQGTP